MKFSGFFRRFQIHSFKIFPRKKENFTFRIGQNRGGSFRSQVEAYFSNYSPRAQGFQTDLFPCICFKLYCDLSRFYKNDTTGIFTLVYY